MYYNIEVGEKVVIWYRMVIQNRLLFLEVHLKYVILIVSIVV